MYACMGVLVRVCHMSQVLQEASACDADDDVRFHAAVALGIVQADISIWLAHRLRPHVVKNIQVLALGDTMRAMRRRVPDALLKSPEKQNEQLRA